MARRVTLYSALLIIMSVLAIACAPRPQAPPPDQEQLILTLEELKQYDGLEGRPAYVAIDGVIYDVSRVSAWSGGRHQGNIAGQDLTDVLKNRSPHGVRVLTNLPIVGKLK